MTRFTVALVMSLWFGSVVSAQQPGQGPIRASLEREAARLVSSLAAHDLTRDGSPAFTVPAYQIDVIRPGARVRVTAASVVEVPGLARLGDTIPLGSILSSDDDTVTVGGSGGQVVTLPRPRHRIVGRIDRIDGQTFTVARSYGPAVTVPRAGVARLERPNGMPSRKRFAKMGLLIGALGGGVVGYVVGGQQDSCIGCAPPSLVSIMFGILGGGAGALVGALVPPAQRWRTVPLSSLAGMFPTPAELVAR